MNIGLIYFDLIEQTKHGKRNKLHYERRQPAQIHKFHTAPVDADVDGRMAPRVGVVFKQRGG